MALARVQSTGRVGGSGVSVVNFTFAAPPTVGNAVILAVFNWSLANLSLATVTDNRGNAYTLAAFKKQTSSVSAAVWFCPAIAATGSPFTITLTAPAANYFVGCAIEVSGVGTGLAVDQTATMGTTDSIGGTTVGPTAALTASEVFLVAVGCPSNSQASITVASVSPTWLQEVEELSNALVAGEIDTRVLTGATGVTTSVSWTITSHGPFAGVLVAFRAGVPAAPALRVTQEAVELFTPSSVLTRTTQLAVETYVPVTGLTVRTTQVVTELYQARPAALRVTQAVVELLTPVPVAVPVRFNPGWLAWIEWPADEDEARRRRAVGHTRRPRSGLPWSVVAYSDWDLQDPPSYYHGFKQARVEQFGEATRTLSEPRSGDWQGSAFDFRLSDFDRLLRTKLASETDRYWTNGPFIVRMVTRQMRAALEDALTVFVGPLRRADPHPPLSVDLLLEDSIGHGMLNDEHLIPQRVILASEWEPTIAITDAAKGHPVPIIYGRHVRAEGAFAPVYLGVENGTQHVWLVAGHYAQVLDVLVDGIGVTGQDPADWTLPGWSGPLYETIGGRRYTLLRGRTGTPPSITDPVLYAENAGTAGASFESWIAGVYSSGVFFYDPASRWDVNATTGPHAGTRALQGTALHENDVAIGHFGLTGATGTAVPRGYHVSSYTALVLYLKNGTAGWGDALLRLRFTIFSPVEPAGVVVDLSDGVYGLDTFDTTTWQTITIPVEDFEVPEDLRPDRLWIYKAGDDPLDVTLDDISLSGGEAVPGVISPADAAADGTSRLTVNVSGWTTTGDETGAVLTAIAEQYRHWLIQYVANPEGYQTGGPLANPTSDLFDRVVALVHEASFTTATTQLVARYPPNGYLGHAIFGAGPGDRLPVRQWISRWNLSADCRFGVSRYGELFIVLHAPTVADQAAALVVDDVLDILEGSFSIDMGWSEQATRLPFRAGFNYATSEWTVFREAYDPALSSAYGRPDGIPGAVREYWFVADADQAANVADQELSRIGHPPMVLQFETALGDLMMRELGDYLTVRHFAGVGPSAARLCQIEALTIAPGTRRLRVRALDVTALLPPEA